MLNFTELPLSETMKKLGFEEEKGESQTFYIETDEQEGDIFLPDLISNDEEIIKEINKKGIVICFTQYLNKDSDNCFFKKAKEELKIEDSDFEQVAGYIIFDEDFNEILTTGICFFTNDGNKGYSFGPNV